MLRAVMFRLAVPTLILGFGLQARLSTGGVPPPANDLCSSAQVVGPGGYYGTNISSNREVDAFCSLGSVAGDVWYSYTPATSGPLNVFVISATMDCVLSVHTDCTGDPGTVVACNDDSGGDNTVGTSNSEVTFSAAAGTTYLIRVSGFGNSAGNFLISIGAPGGTPTSDCGNVRNFPSIGSTFVGGGTGNFESPTSSPPMWNAVRGDKATQSFQIYDRPVYFEMFLDLYIENSLGGVNSLTFNVKVGGGTVGSFTINAGEPSGRRKLFYTFGGQVGTIALSIEAANSIPDLQGSVAFGCAGEKSSFVEFHGVPFTTIEESENGTYASTGAHSASEHSVLIGHSGASPGVNRFNGFFYFLPGAVKGTKVGSLRLFVAAYNSPDPTETITVSPYIGSAPALTSNYPDGSPEGLAVFNLLESGAVLGSQTVRASDAGKFIEIPLNGGLGDLLAQFPVSQSFGIHLSSLDHGADPGTSEYVSFGDLTSGHQLMPRFCPDPDAGELYAADQSGNIFRVDPANSRFDYIGPLGDQTTDLEYDIVRDRLLGFEPGLMELRQIDLLTLIQPSGANAGQRFGSFKFAGSRLFGATTFPSPTSEIFEIDPVGGSSMPASIVPLPSRVASMALDRASGYFFAIRDTLPGTLYRFSPFHSEITTIGDTGVEVGSLEFDASGTLFAGGVGGSAGKFFEIDTATGQATQAFVTPFSNIVGLCKVRSPFNRRPFGDLDTDFCTGIGDFLILLDRWQLVYPPLGGPVIDLVDFLNLLDNWQAGAAC